MERTIKLLKELNRLSLLKGKRVGGCEDVLDQYDQLICAAANKSEHFPTISVVITVDRRV